MKTPTAEINIQDEVQKIHAQFGVSEMANYKIQKLFDQYTTQQSGIVVAKRDEEIRKWIGKNSHFTTKTYTSPKFSVDSLKLQEFLSTPTVEQAPVNIKDFPRESSNPWCSRDVLLQLITASEKLLGQYNYDGHSHEKIQIAINRGREIVQILETPTKSDPTIKVSELEEWLNNPKHRCGMVDTFELKQFINSKTKQP